MLWGLSCAVLFPSLPRGCPDLERGWSLPCSQHSGGAGAAGVVRVVSHCWYGLAQDKGPLGTAVGPAEEQPWTQRLFLRSQSISFPRGSGCCRGQGRAESSRCCHSGVMTSLLQLCQCHPEGSLSWGSKSESGTGCRPAGSPSGYPLETLARSSQSLLPLLPNSRGLIREIKGSQASVNTLRGNLHLFYEHQIAISRVLQRIRWNRKISSRTQVFSAALECSSTLQ